MSQTKAAVVTKSTGEIYAERNGERITLKQGDTVYETDTILTDNSRAVLTFEDGATATLGPKSTLIIKDFSYGDDVEPSFIIQLTTGVMRSVSGAIVEENPDAFRVLTPKATVAIRGTEFITKINLDGTEMHFVISIDQGHNLVLTSHTGAQVSFSAAQLGAIISNDGSIQKEFNLDDASNLDEIIKKIIKTLAPNLDMDEASQHGASPIVMLQMAAEQALAGNEENESVQTESSLSAENSNNLDTGGSISSSADSDNDSDSDSSSDSDGNSDGTTGSNSGSGSGGADDSQTSTAPETTPPPLSTGDDDDGESIEYDIVISGKTITTGDKDDDLTFKNTVTNTTINTMGGNDQVKFDVAATTTNVNLGEGENQLTAEAAFSGNITGGSAKDQITIKGDYSGNMTLGAGENQITLGESSTQEFQGSITTGNDKDQITVEGDFYGSVTTGGGEDTIESKGRFKSSASIDAGAGDDTITIESAYGDTPSTSTITAGEGADEIIVNEFESASNVAIDLTDTDNAVDTIELKNTGSDTANVTITNFAAGEDEITIGSNTYSSQAEINALNGTTVDGITITFS